MIENKLENNRASQRSLRAKVRDLNLYAMMANDDELDALDSELETLLDLLKALEKDEIKLENELYQVAG